MLVQLTGRLAGIGRGFARWALRGVPMGVFRHELEMKIGTLSGVGKDFTKVKYSNIAEFIQ